MIPQFSPKPNREKLLGRPLCKVCGLRFFCAPGDYVWLSRTNCPYRDHPHCVGCGEIIPLGLDLCEGCRNKNTPRRPVRGDIM